MCNRPQDLRPRGVSGRTCAARSSTCRTGTTATSAWCDPDHRNGPTRSRLRRWTPCAETANVSWWRPGELPKRQRDCVVLRIYADLSDAEIADALGISAGSVKTHLHRARLALADGLEALR